jgi:phosphoserine phosphatase
MLKERIVPLSTLPSIFILYLLKRMHWITLEELHERVFRTILKGCSLHRLEEAADRFVKPVIERYLNRAVYQRFLIAVAHSQKVYLLSSSPDFLVSRIGKELGFDGWAGTEYSIDKEGKLCEISTLVTGNQKLEIAKRWSQGFAIAYSDHIDDLPLLEWAGKAILVNPESRLRAIGKSRGWEFLESLSR